MTDKQAPAPPAQESPICEAAPSSTVDGAADSSGPPREGDEHSAVQSGSERAASPAAEASANDAATVADDLEQLTARTSERDEYLALAQRTQADFDNYRKRVAREAAAALARGTANLARELLPALDNLDRALAAVTEESAQLVEGMRLVRSELHAALARAGIEAFEPVGETFDPELHEAVAQQPVQGAQVGTVVEVYQAGYRLSGGALIRPARVLVAG